MDKIKLPGPQIQDYVPELDDDGNLIGRDGTLFDEEENIFIVEKLRRKRHISTEIAQWAREPVSRDLTPAGEYKLLAELGNGQWKDDEGKLTPEFIKCGMAIGTEELQHVTIKESVTAEVTARGVAASEKFEEEMVAKRSPFCKIVMKEYPAVSKEEALEGISVLEVKGKKRVHGEIQVDVVHVGNAHFNTIAETYPDLAKTYQKETDLDNGEVKKEVLVTCLPYEMKVAAKRGRPSKSIGGKPTGGKPTGGKPTSGK